MTLASWNLMTINQNRNDQFLLLTAFEQMANNEHQQ